MYMDKNEKKNIINALTDEIEFKDTLAKSFNNENSDYHIQIVDFSFEKPDTDNIAKSILDSLNKIAYLDDKQVVDLEVHKFYNEKPCTFVIIQTINNLED